MQKRNKETISKQKAKAGLLQFSDPVGSCDFGQQRAAREGGTQLEVSAKLDLVVTISICGVRRLVYACAQKCALVSTGHLFHLDEAGGLPPNSKCQGVAGAVVTIHPIISVNTAYALNYTSRAIGSAARRGWWIALYKSIH